MKPSKKKFVIEQITLEAAIEEGLLDSFNVKNFLIEADIDEFLSHPRLIWFIDRHGNERIIYFENLEEYENLFEMVGIKK